MSTQIGTQPKCPSYSCSIKTLETSGLIFVCALRATEQRDDDNERRRQKTIPGEYKDISGSTLLGVWSLIVDSYGGKLLNS